MYQKTFNESDLSKPNILGFIYMTGLNSFQPNRECKQRNLLLLDSRRTVYEQFLKLLNVHKACSDLGKDLLYLGKYIYLYFSNSVTKSSCNQLFACSTVSAIVESAILNTRNFRFRFEIMADLKVGEVTQEVSHSQNV